MNARRRMAIALLIAGIAFYNGRLDAFHAIAHQLGTTYKITHSAADEIMLPAVMILKPRLPR